LKRFASAILTAPALDLALKELVRQGSLRESSGGWQLTLRGQQRARQLSRIEA
jgi:hypothetical protein